LEEEQFVDEEMIEMKLHNLSLVDCKETEVNVINVS
jgi:hypothetical protein